MMNFTTKKGAYINQDMVSAYFGHFHEGKMISGQEAKITDLKNVENIAVPIFGDMSGPVFNRITFDKENLLNGLTPDPLEEKYVYVNQSTIGMSNFC